MEEDADCRVVFDDDDEVRASAPNCACAQVGTGRAVSGNGPWERNRLSRNRRLQALMAAILSDTGGQVGSPLPDSDLNPSFGRPRRTSAPGLTGRTPAHICAGTACAYAAFVC